MLEHHPNPVFFLQDQLKVLKPGGVLYCKIPNKNFMYDKPRASTTTHTFKQKFENSMFEISIEEAYEIITQTGPHSNYDQLKLNVEESALQMVESRDGTHHFNVFEVENTFDLIKLVQFKRGDVYVAHFSALQNENIEFSLKIIGCQ